MGANKAVVVHSPISTVQTFMFTCVLKPTLSLMFVSAPASRRSFTMAGLSYCAALMSADEPNL